MVNYSDEVRNELRQQLVKGDQVILVQRLKDKGVRVSTNTLNQFLTGARPMKTIGQQVVEEAKAMFTERKEANQQALESLRAIAA